MSDKNEIGSIVWHDLSIKHAEDVKEFYANVVGWKSEAVGMGNYDDYNMNSPKSGECIAGICHARGASVGLPAQWLMYVKVSDADQSARDCIAAGGKILNGPTKMDNQTYYTIQDPAGAALAIFS